MAFTARLGTAESRLGNIQLGFGASGSLALSATGGLAIAGGGELTVSPIPRPRLPTLAVLGANTRAARIGIHITAVRVITHDNEVIVTPNRADVLMPV